MTRPDSVFPARDASRSFLDASWWARTTEALVADSDVTTALAIEPIMGDYLRWLELTARRRAIPHPELLESFLRAFGRAAANVGEVGHRTRSVLGGLETAIELAQPLDSSVGAHLWRAKATYHRTLETESEQRLFALDRAIAVASVGSGDWVGAHIDKSEYLVEVSRYDEAVAVLEPVEARLGAVEFTDDARCGAMVARGVALYSSFRDVEGAQRLFEAAISSSDNVQTRDGRAWLARAYHYLGRIRETQGEHERGLHDFVAGLRVQVSLPEDTNALGFVHLRIADLLTAQGLRDPAREHLGWAQALFRSGTNQASGRLQAALSDAALQASKGKLFLAERVIEETRAHSAELGFWRGELLCAGYLLSLSIRQRRWGQSFLLLFAALRTARRGELGRNGFLLVLRRIPFGLRFARYRLGLASRRTGRRSRTITSCICGLHSNPAMPVASADRRHSTA